MERQREISMREKHINWLPFAQAPTMARAGERPATEVRALNAGLFDLQAVALYTEQNRLGL